MALNPKPLGLLCIDSDCGFAEARLEEIALAYRCRLAERCSAVAATGLSTRSSSGHQTPPCLVLPRRSRTVPPSTPGAGAVDDDGADDGAGDGEALSAAAPARRERRSASRYRCRTASRSSAEPEAAPPLVANRATLHRPTHGRANQAELQAARCNPGVSILSDGTAASRAASRAALALSCPSRPPRACTRC